jgi:hypothetical protein
VLNVLLEPFGAFVNAKDGCERSLEKLVIKYDADAGMWVSERQGEYYNVKKDDKC